MGNVSAIAGVCLNPSLSKPLKIVSNKAFASVSFTISNTKSFSFNLFFLIYLINFFAIAGGTFAVLVESFFPFADKFTTFPKKSIFPTFIPAISDGLIFEPAANSANKAASSYFIFFLP